MRSTRSLSSSRRLLYDARGAVLVEYLVVASMGIGIATAVAALVMTVEEINDRAQELMPLNVP